MSRTSIKRKYGHEQEHDNYDDINSKKIDIKKYDKKLSELFKLIFTNPFLCKKIYDYVHSECASYIEFTTTVKYDIFKATTYEKSIMSRYCNHRRKYIYYEEYIGNIVMVNYISIDTYKKWRRYKKSDLVLDNLDEKSYYELIGEQSMMDIL